MRILTMYEETNQGRRLSETHVSNNDMTTDGPRRTRSRIPPPAANPPQVARQVRHQENHQTNLGIRVDNGTLRREGTLMSLDFRGNGNTNSKRDWTS